VALIFEPWYEGWGTEDAWESGDYFDGIMEAANVDAIVGTIKVVLWVVTIVCAVACILLYLLSKKVEPSKAEIDAAFKKSCDAISARHNKELEEMTGITVSEEVERAAEAAEKVEQAVDKVEEAFDKVEDKLEDAADKVEDAIEDIVDKVKKD
ncbi:MAG: hypothetical protein IJL99_03625, partial [Firmicutes bacterium]|nr:hypothetical protein [Bacillota bacterium]MBR0127329.1 hypothetical protein [Bacillota bacterium]